MSILFAGVELGDVTVVAGEDYTKTTHNYIAQTGKAIRLQIQQLLH